MRFHNSYSFLLGFYFVFNWTFCIVYCFYPFSQPYQEFQPYQQARSSYNSEEYEPVPVYGPNAPNDLSGPTSSDHRSAIPVYERPEPPTFRAPMHRPKQINQYVPRPEDQHKGPHSFGKGYSFEFSGWYNGT